MVLRGEEDTAMVVLVMVRLELSVTVFDVDLDPATVVTILTNEALKLAE